MCVECVCVCELRVLHVLQCIYSLCVCVCACSMGSDVGTAWVRNSVCLAWLVCCVVHVGALWVDQVVCLSVCVRL